MVALLWLASRGTDDTNDELHGDHADGTIEENGSSSKTLNDVEGHWCRADVNERGDQANQEWVADAAELLEEDCTEVEDEVDAGELLHHLHTNTKECATEVG